MVDVTAAPYSAAGDGVSGDRVAIQGALDDVSAAGGGTVVLPAGRTFLTGSITLRNNTTLQVDGTLLQSQNPADYGYPPLRGHDASGTVSWDHTGYHNLPMVHARDTHDVSLTGSGTIRLTRDQSIELMAVGFYDVDRFTISGVSIRDSAQYNIALFHSEHGIVDGVDVQAIPGQGNTDAVSVQNSQDIRITNSTFVVSDDGVYVWASYADPRSYAPSWWSSDSPQPSRNIEVDHNDITINSCCLPYGKAFGLIAWGSGAPDQRDVQISDIYVHDNVFRAPEAVGIWPDNVFDASKEQSPISRVRIDENERITDGGYAGSVTFTWPTSQITDLRDQFGHSSVGTVQNGGFESTGAAWWSARGAAGATSAAAADVLRDPVARAAATALDPDGWVGYVQPDGDESAQLYEGLGLAADTYTAVAQVVTGPGGADLFAYDTCTGQELASTSVVAGSPKRFVLVFEVAEACGDVQVGLRGEVSDGWALVDNVTVASSTMSTTIDDRDPAVTYEGSWGQYAAAGDWKGGHTTAVADGAAVTIPFTGSQARVLGVAGDYLGNAEVYLDGALVGTADYYRPEHEVVGATIFDTGPIPYGEHTLKLVRTGTKNPAATPGYYIDFDALAIEPATVPSPPLPAPVAVTAPSVTGSARVGGLLVAHPGEWDTGGVAFAYQWLADGAAIAGATDSTFSVPAELAGKPIAVRVTATTARVADGVAEATPVTVHATAPWDAGIAYDEGDQVLNDGRLFVAAWWTQNQEPGASPYGPWREAGVEIAAADRTVATWTDSWIYQEKDTVAHDGHVWTAKWWNRNQEPGDPNGPWHDLGAY